WVPAVVQKPGDPFLQVQLLPVLSSPCTATSSTPAQGVPPSGVRVIDLRKESVYLRSDEAEEHAFAASSSAAGGAARTPGSAGSTGAAGLSPHLITGGLNQRTPGRKDGKRQRSNSSRRSSATQMLTPSGGPKGNTSGVTRAMVSGAGASLSSSKPLSLSGSK
ncbi:unnamed protein product, partial [Amoebophrya sp. A25]